jgi:hypothetical protein
MRVEIQKRQNVRYTVVDTVFPDRVVKCAIHFVVDVQKDVLATERRLAFLLNLFQRV